jgi:hypothetical protein
MVGKLVVFHDNSAINWVNYKKGVSWVVSVVSGYGVDDGRSRFDPWQRRKNFSSFLCVQTGSGAHPATCAIGTGDPFLANKARQGRNADQSPPSSVEDE